MYVNMKNTPAAAKQWLGSMRDLFKFAVKRKLLFVNPAVGIERFGSGNPDGHHCWTHEEVEQFRRRHPIGTKARPALELINALAFRRSDVIAVGPPNVKNGVLKYRQAKFMNISPSDIEVPMPARPVDLMAIIRQTVPTGLQTWLVDGHGKPYTDLLALVRRPLRRSWLAGEDPAERRSGAAMHPAPRTVCASGA
jgi:hypothetical protein